MINIDEFMHLEGSMDHVSINSEAIHNFVKDIDESSFDNNTVSFLSDALDLKDRVIISTYFNALNYCFWAELGKPKWNVIVDGQELDGGIAVMKYIESLYLNNSQFKSPCALKNLKYQDFRKLFTTNIEISLIKERYGFLVDTARVLCDLGTDVYLEEILHRASLGAGALLEYIEKTIPHLTDISMYKENELNFGKRHQLLVSVMINDIETFNGVIIEGKNILTGFADYKVPQLLRNLGIIVYSDDLAERINRGELIPHGSNQEIEIRMASVIAIEKIRGALDEKGIKKNSAEIDSLIWLSSQNIEGVVENYHRSYTTNY